MASFILHAPNIHTGGGLVLLKLLLEELQRFDTPVRLHLDARMAVQTHFPAHFQVHYFERSFWGRFQAERSLKECAKAGDSVLCFGNLPPLFKSSAKVFLFLQNRNMLGLNPLSSFGFPTALRIAAERTWLRYFSRNVNEFLVQTPTMQEQTRIALGLKQPVHMSPFVGGDSYTRKIEGFAKNSSHYDFLYVSSEDPHKNHRRLVEAWILLAKLNLFPSLCVTIPSHGALWKWIDEQRKNFKLRIENAEPASHEETMKLYSTAGALIFPSTSESLGLPLIEARQAGLPILASELDFIRDIVDPEQSFDPNSAVSISRAVRRHLGKEQGALVTVKAKEFLQLVCS